VRPSALGSPQTWRSRRSVAIDPKPSFYPSMTDICKRAVYCALNRNIGLRGKEADNGSADAD
jgi:hypothetical protein